MSVEQVHDILNRARISDDEIRGGITLSDQGYQKIAARIGSNVDEVKSLIATLVSDLQEDHNQEVTEGHSLRYAYESDYLGNLTIRDSEGGNEHYISGSDSAHIIALLRKTKSDSPQEQAMLARLCADHSTLHEDDSDAVGGNFNDEIKTEAGSYNFPWRAGSRFGTGTAAYRIKGKQFEVDVIDVRDDRGEPVDDRRLDAEIAKQARAFIGNE